MNIFIISVCIIMKVLTTNADTCPSTISGTYCDSDCSTLLACQKGSTTPVVRLACPDVAPYCIPGTNTCSPISDSTNPKCVSSNSASDFICTDIGYFPNPSNCSKYHYCDDTGTAYDIDCPSRYVYDSTTERCKRYVGQRDCATISCSKQSRFPSYLTYSNQPSFYALCYKDGSEIKTLMQKCVDTKNYEFSLNSIKCEFKCRSDDNFADINDCSKYFECYRQRARYDVRHVTCPIGTYFNTESKICVRGSCATEAVANSPITVSSEISANPVPASVSPDLDVPVFSVEPEISLNPGDNESSSILVGPELSPRSSVLEDLELLAVTPNPGNLEYSFVPEDSISFSVSFDPEDSESYSESSISIVSESSPESPVSEDPEAVPESSVPEKSVLAFSRASKPRKSQNNRS